MLADSAKRQGEFVVLAPIAQVARRHHPSPGPLHALVDPGDGPAAGADGNQVEHRQEDRQMAQLAARRQDRVAAGDQRRVGVCAAHVEGNDVVDATGGGDDGAADDAPHGPEWVRATGRRLPPGGS